VFVSVLCFRPKSSAKAAAAAMQCKHSPDGGIQWLRVKPGMCFIWLMRPASHRRIRMAIKIASNLPAFCVVLHLVFAHNVS
jgi:hypothetical protein